MKTLFRIAMLMLFLASCNILFAQQKEVKCGTWRWDVKTLTDKAGTGLISVKPVLKSIDQLVKENPPKKLNEENQADGKLPRYPDENLVVEFTCNVIVFGDKDEDKDRDLHMIFKSLTSGNTMIGEIPDPACPDFDKYPQLRELYKQVRLEAGKVKDKLKQTKKPVKVKISGVPFWDGAGDEKEKGESKYNREIHPVTKIEIL